jgi:hypothetical protein
MKTLTFISVGIIAFTMSAQTTKKEVAVSKFTKLDISSALGVTYVKGNTYKAEITAPARYMNNVKVSNEGRKLVLKLECENCRTKDGESFSIMVTAPSIEAVEITGACSFKSAAAIDAKNLKLDVSGASSVNLDLKVDYLDLDVEGASSAKLEGSAKKVDADVSGASSFKGQELSVETMKITCEGVSSSKVNVTENLVANSSGMSKVSNTKSARKQSVTSDDVEINIKDDE